MKTHRGVCGFCLTGQCCQGLREFDSFTCSHARRCELYTEEEDPVKELQEAWRQLDDEVDQIVNVADALNTEGDIDGAQTATLGELKARARGKAEILAVFMQAYAALSRDGNAVTPWTADEVSTEAGKRRAMRVRGREYVTMTSLGQALQLEGSPDWTRDGRGFLRVAS